MSKSAAEAGSEIGQWLGQYNDNEQEQEVGDAGDEGIIQQTQDSGSQNNTATQNAQANGADATSTAGAVTNTEEVEAGGDALVSKSAAEAGSEIGQWLDQSNGNEQEQEVGDVGDLGIIEQEQTSSSQSNTAEFQVANGSSDASSTAGAVTNTEEVEAGGDALVSKSAAEAGSEIGQWLGQYNDNEQEQEVGDVGDEGIIEQTQASGPQSNTGEQSVDDADVDATSTAGAVTNTEEVEAGGDALVSKSAAEAETEIGQASKQSNDNEQEQEVGDVGDLGIIEQEQTSSSKAIRQSNPPPRIGPSRLPRRGRSPIRRKSRRAATRW